jgi:hypothetical protein
MDPVAAHAALQAIGAELLRVAPASVEQVRVLVQSVGGFSQQYLTTIAADGSETELDAWTQDSFDDDLDALRAATATPDGGAWFTATITARRDGDVSAHYDYDAEPDFGPVPATATNYRTDLTRFPRSEANIPQWLRRYVDAAD